MIHLIAAVAQNGVIGRDGRIPWYLPDDLARFRRLTMGQTVLMGRRTYESIRARIGGALPGRQNIVLSRQRLSLPDAQVAPSLAEGLRLAARPEVYIIGGGEVYAQALPLAEQLDLTLVEDAPAGDARFPAVPWAEFAEIFRERHDGAPAWTYVTYRRKGR